MNDSLTSLFTKEQKCDLLIFLSDSLEKQMSEFPTIKKPFTFTYKYSLHCNKRFFREKAQRHIFAFWRLSWVFICNIQYTGSLYVQLYVHVYCVGSNPSQTKNSPCNAGKCSRGYICTVHCMLSYFFCLQICVFGLQQD